MGKTESGNTQVDKLCFCLFHSSGSVFHLFIPCKVFQRPRCLFLKGQFHDIWSYF